MSCLKQFRSIDRANTELQAADDYFDCLRQTFQPSLLQEAEHAVSLWQNTNWQLSGRALAQCSSITLLNVTNT